MARGSTRARKQDSARPGVADPTAPLDGGELLTAARLVLSLLRTDLEARATDPGVTQVLEARYEDEKKHKLTGDSFAAWREARIAQVAASWFLSCVFVRTLEDRGLLGQARLAGPGAMDSQAMFFQLAPSLTERDYLLFVFRELAELPASRALFDREHALVWQLSPSAEAAKDLLRLFRTPSAETPAFRFGQASTRFLGDLYQDLYEDVRKRFALLQTPDFIERFILDRTLEPAIVRFGLDDTTLIDPTCGSGHFLLGAFERLFEHRLRQTPGIDVHRAAQLALDAVFGADINPYAVAIARMRMTLAFLDKGGITKVKDAPALPLHLVVADSLLHNPQHVQLELEHQVGQSSTKGWRAEAFALENEHAARDVLHRQYAAVVGNPPYITPKDRALRTAYAEMYGTCFMNYALSVPFCERFFQLARDRGYVGQITANSFMKREFGKRLIADYLPTVNLELIVNTSGAYIPGHGTPTVLLFGTHESPTARKVGAVLAKRGEPSTPQEPAKGRVWSSIASHWNDIEFENDYISVTTIEREKLATHPWSLGGGGAAELKELLEEQASSRLSEVIDDIGFSIIVGEDDLFLRPSGRRIWKDLPRISIVVGNGVRDWFLFGEDDLLSPFVPNGWDVDPNSVLKQELWPWRVVLRHRVVSGSTTMEEAGKEWFDVRRLSRTKHQTSLSITFAEVATHNHFVFDRGGKVFGRTAPIIKLPAIANEDDHLALLAYLNSSVACFLVRQVCQNKGGQGVNEGLKSEEWEQFIQRSGGALSTIPVFISPRLVELGRSLHELAEQRGALGAARVFASQPATSVEALRDALSAEYAAERALLDEMAEVQEAIDWTVYELAGLVSDQVVTSLCATRFGPGSRAFEHRLLRTTPSTQWFVRNQYADPRRSTEVPREVAQRERLIEKVPELQLLEQPEFKRRWIVRDAAEETQTAARQWLANALETRFAAPECRSRRVVVDEVLALPGAHAISQLAFTGTTEPAAIVREVLASSAVGFVAATRFTDSGLANHAQWIVTWAAQRAEDVGGPPVTVAPPKYDKNDYVDNVAWTLRGKLDVPKERFISYPGCESDQDGEPVYGWAGWNYLQRAQALAALYQKRKTEEGWTADRLTPMLAGLLELLPWIQQWHNDLDPDYGLRMGDYFAQFLDGELATLGLTKVQLEGWRPTKRNSGRPMRKPKVAPVTAPKDRPSAQPKRKPPRPQPRISPLPPIPAIRPQMPAELETALVVVALLHVAGGALTRTELARAFALRARPDLLTQLAPSSLSQAGEWARKVGERSVSPGMLASTLRAMVDRRGVEFGIDAQSRSTVRTSTGTPAEAQLDPWFRFEATLALEVLRAQPTNAFDAIDATLEGEDHSLLEEAA
jgi:hypothetical protein